MHRPAETRRPHRSTLRRAAAAALATCFAALVAVGCGGDQGAGAGGAGASGIVGDEGPLAWLPAETWLVASVDVNPGKLDTAVQTLDRLPIWSLAEGFLPASDGEGLRRELLRYIIDQNRPAAGSGATVTAKELEAAFGDRAGIAVIGTDFSDDETPPLVVWIEVDDDERAIDVARRLADEKLATREHEGVEYLSGRDTGAFLARDGLLVAAPTRAQLEAVIDVRDGDDDTLADDAEARALIEVGIGEAMGGVAVQSTPLLEAAPELVRLAAEEADDPKEAARARLAAARLAPLLESPAIDDLVPDWTATSITIDETGLRSRSAWSNPRELADPKVGARELAERMPADAPVVYAGVHDGSGVERLQDAWSEVRDAYELDLRELSGECDRDVRALCSLGAEAALALLEDDALAEAMREAGDTSFAWVQDPAVLLEGALRPGGAAGSGTAPEERAFEVATSGERPAWKPPAQLFAAARRAGLAVELGASSATLRVLPDSPLARQLARTQADPESRSALRSLGLDPRALASPRGLTISREEVDGIRVSGVPDRAPSKVVPALEGDADTLGEQETYETVLEAVDVPDEVGAYGYLDLRAYVEAILTAVSAEVPEVRRVVPTVRNNLADVPGVVWWSTREEHDGEEVGVFEVVTPILE